MRYNFILTGVFFFILFKGISQTKQYLYYLDKDFKSIEKPKAVFNGIGKYKNGVIELKLYSSLNKNLVMIEHFTDSSLQISDGLFQSFYNNDSIESEGNYVKGKEDGLWKQWDTLQHVIDSSIYKNGEKIMEVHSGYYKNGYLDSFIVNDISGDRLAKTYYDENGKIISAVNFTGQNGILRRYNKGVLTNTDTVFTREETEAFFPGGEAAWTQYISKSLSDHGDELLKDGASGTCRVKFIVDTEGKIKNAIALTMQSSLLAKIAVYAIKHGPNWIPAMQYGRRVNAYREEPITFTVDH